MPASYMKGRVEAHLKPSLPTEGIPTLSAGFSKSHQAVLWSLARPLNSKNPLPWALQTLQKKMWIKSWRNWARSTRAMPTISCTRIAITFQLLWQRSCVGRKSPVG
ncbi:Hypothetical predicted protein [Podarcis lilfordi]|uniref:Uncharacterized protein n=1 Tax=Podarcis lilfordi TaxID=74358 RepID=A0AA35NWA5_9SAUR|nr:Hypothetical predicted protein [Podarcis lilfordi]